MLPLTSSQAQAYDREFRRSGVREQGRGRGLVAVAVLIRLWPACQLFFSFTSALRTVGHAAEVTRLNAVREP